MTDINSADVINLYNDGISIRQIAVQFGVSPTKIKNILIKNGVPIKTKGEQQTLGYKTGSRKKNFNKKSDEVKAKIGDTLAQYWKNLSLEKRAELAQKSRDTWYNVDVDKVQERREKAWEALRKTAKEGSRLEHYIVDNLRKEGYEVKTHIKGMIPNEKLEIDILIPRYRLVIEIDGPAHFMPIWGEKRLNKTRSADTRKNGLLLSNKYSVLRVKCLITNMSDYILRSCLKICKQELQNMEKDSTTRLIEREVI